MEYVEGGDLFSYLEQRKFRLTESRTKQLIRKLAKCLKYLHSYGIVHRDLKPENIMMTSKEDNADFLILDFGLSIILGPGEKTRESVGTLVIL